MLYSRDENFERESAVIVACDRQLNDLVKFCTNETQFWIMIVDHTFSLGNFDVTMTTYRQLVLTWKCTSNHPVFIGANGDGLHTLTSYGSCVDIFVPGDSIIGTDYCVITVQRKSSTW